MTDLAAMRAKGVAKFAVTPPDERKKRRFLLALCGGAIGVVNGLFGAGGGMLAVPVLAFAAGLPQKAVILPLCVVSTVVYAVRGGFETDILLPTVLGVLAGGIAGAALLKKLSAPVLNLLFYGLMLFAGIKMMV